MRVSRFDILSFDWLALFSSFLVVLDALVFMKTASLSQTMTELAVLSPVSASSTAYSHSAFSSHQCSYFEKAFSVKWS